MSKPIRAVLPLLKAPIADITDRGFNILLGANYGSPTTVRVTLDTRQLDLREGDVITVYTEVFLKTGAGNA